MGWRMKGRLNVFGLLALGMLFVIAAGLVLRIVEGAPELIGLILIGLLTIGRWRLLTTGRLKSPF
jgi:hypothetical protein